MCVYVGVFVYRCYVVYCTSVRSHPDSKEGVRCEIRSARYWGRHGNRNTFGEGDQEEAQSKPGLKP